MVGCHVPVVHPESFSHHLKEEINLLGVMQRTWEMILALSSLHNKDYVLHDCVCDIVVHVIICVCVIRL